MSSHRPRPIVPAQRGMALMATLFALVLLMLLALPFAVSMSVGADAARRDLDEVAVTQASASVREQLLTDAAMSHPAIDPTPSHDGLDEYPDGLELPAAFAELGENGRMRLGGEVVDLQRQLGLDGASPLVFANALGATTSLSEDLLPEATKLVVNSADALPDSGYLWIAGELLRYGEKKGNELLALERALMRDQGFAAAEQPIVEGTLVLDFRCVLAAAWPIVGGTDPARRTREPYRSSSELVAIGNAGLGSFTAAELDTFARVFAADTMATNAATWGRPARVFNDLRAGLGKSMVVKSALHLGAGSTVRLTNLRTGAQEYGLVMASSTQTGNTELQFPAVYELELLYPVVADFPATDTTVEPLIPAPVNVNTASAEVLEVLFAEVRQGAQVRVADAAGRRAAAPLRFTRSDARELASRIVTLRTPADGAGGPFTGWQDLVQRLLQPKLEAASSNPDRLRWLNLYRNLQTGRDSLLEMGTAPLCFQSGPWVRYRAAASRQRSAVAAGIAGRHERSGTAVAMPGFLVERRWAAQDAFEEAFLLDRRAPYWVTTPINLGHTQRGEAGNDPAPRYFPHLVPLAFPQLGFGAPRFAATDAADSGITPSVATTPPGAWPNVQLPRGFESFAQATNVRGHDVNLQGPYAMQNTSPAAPGAGGAAGGAGNQGGGGQDGLKFPFATPNGFADRFAVSCWLEPQSLQNVTLFEYGGGDTNRNRILLAGRDGNLVFELLDEAGLDPAPSSSPAGVPRTASEWYLSLAELNLPANTPLHLSASAYAARPGDLSFAVDGVTRGKPRFVTHLTSALRPFDPSLANNNNVLPPQGGNERYLDLQVESTDGFPDVGILRIGLELFEYSSRQGNTFRCRFIDSQGGRGARQSGREHRPALPLDANGNPTVDINDPQFQGANLDVFPAIPAGSLVELYGYSALPSESTAMMVGSTQLVGAVGAFAVARGFVANPRQIALTTPNTTIQLGRGIDATWQGDIELANPVPNAIGDTNYPPPAAAAEIADAFATGGGYALLVQWGRTFNFTPQGQLSASKAIGGIELVRYQARQGTRLTGVQRAQRLPGNDAQIDQSLFQAGLARDFICDWEEFPVPGNNQARWDNIPTRILWVVPISLGVQNASVLWDPQTTQLTEWIQLRPQGAPNDVEWVRYDVLAENRFVCRANRAAWSFLNFQLTQQFQAGVEDLTPLGPNNTVAPVLVPPWGTVPATAGFIGYTPTLENTYPQIHSARLALGFRGDPFTRTSSHPQTNSRVTQCQRLQLPWGNFGAYTGRLGRHDRVALIQGSVASGSRRPNVEWQTVTWACRRFESDNLNRNQTPTEFLGPWPFQLAAFDDGLRVPLLGPARGVVIDDSRRFDRIVKFPSGELPAAYCQAPVLGAGVGNTQAMRGIVDEVEITAQLAPDLVLEEDCTDTARSFRVNRSLALNAAGGVWLQNDVSASLPRQGGLVQLDTEVLAYQTHADGVFTVASSGRGLLNTTARAHARGARVRFLTHRPMAILGSGIGPRDAELPLVDRGPLPTEGTLLLGRELLHYAWMRARGGQVLVEMPRWYPSGADRVSSQSRGLFRGRYGTAPQSGAAGEAVIGFPFRHWDRYAERSDDPELGYFQLTTNEAPVLFRTLRWRQETVDARVGVVCLVRGDGWSGFDAEPGVAPGLWLLSGAGENGASHRIDFSGSRLEIRFAVQYRPGVLDLNTFQAHGWKTTARVEDVRLEYDGQGRILGEQVTAR
jgi:hypothetical protein